MSKQGQLEERGVEGDMEVVIVLGAESKEKDLCAVQEIIIIECLNPFKALTNLK